MELLDVITYVLGHLGCHQDSGSQLWQTSNISSVLLTIATSIGLSCRQDKRHRYFSVMDRIVLIL
jgi:hypothetical protein